MATDFRKLLQSLQKGQYAPVYLIDGEEPFYLDIITEYFEEKILQPAERDFNLTVMYGKDAEWPDVVNACRRFPMFAERQVVILKDAAQMKTLGELTAYVEHPSPSTVFLIEHRFKKADGRSKLTKLIQEKYTYFSSAKIKDSDIPHWIMSFCEDNGLRIHPREAETLAASLGNDLQKIANEINKVRINMPEGEGELTAQLIQKYIGISHEYNAFQYPEALTGRDKDKLYRMLGYFVANPKAAPIPLLVGSLYNHFERMYAMHFTAGKSAKDIAAALKLRNEWAAKSYMGQPPYSLYQMQECLRTLAEWSGKFVGINSNISDVEWLKEFTARIELILSGVPAIS